MDIATNSTGASTAQFATQLTGLESSFNRLTAAWEGLYTSFNSSASIFSLVLDTLAGLVGMFADLGVGTTSLIGLIGIFSIKVAASAGASLAAASASGVATAAQVGFRAALAASGASLTNYTAKAIGAAVTTGTIALPILAVVAALGLLTGALWLAIKGEEIQQRKRDKAIEQSKATVASLQQEERSLKSLSAEYEKAYKNGEDLTEIRQKILDKYPELIGYIDDETDGYEELINKINEYIKQKKIAAAEETGKKITTQAEDYNSKKERLEENKRTAKNKIRDFGVKIKGAIEIDRSDLEKTYTEGISLAQEQLVEIEDKIRALGDNFTIGASDRSVLAGGIVADQNIDDSNAEKIISLLMFGIKPEDIDEKTGKLTTAYQKTIIDGYEDSKDKIKDVLESKDTSSEDKTLVENLIGGKISEFSTADWARLNKVLGGGVADLFGAVKDTWQNKRDELTKQLSESGLLIDGVLPDALSNEMASTIARVINGLPEGESRDAAIKYYQKVFSDGLKDAVATLPDGAKINFLSDLQNIDLSDGNAVVNVLAKMGSAGLTTGEAYEELAKQLKGATIATEGLLAPMKEATSGYEILKKSLDGSGLTFDELNTLMQTSGKTAEELGATYDVGTGTFILASEAVNGLGYNIQNLTNAQLEAEKVALLAAASNAIYEGKLVDTGNETYNLANITWDNVVALIAEKGAMENLSAEEGAAIQTLKNLTDQQYLLNMMIRGNSYDDYRSKVGGATKAIDKNKEALDKQTNALESQQDALKAQMRPYEDMIEAIERENDALSYQIDLLDRQKRAIEKVIKEKERQKEAIEKENNAAKDEANTTLDAMMDRAEALEALANAGLNPFDAKYVGMTNKELIELAKNTELANKESERAIEIEKAKEALEKAKASKTKRVYYADKGWVWEADQKAIDETQKNLDDILKSQEESKKEAWLNEIGNFKDSIAEAKDAIGKTLEEVQKELELMKKISGMTWNEMGDQLSDFVEESIPKFQETNQQIAEIDKELEGLNEQVNIVQDSIDSLNEVIQTNKDKISDIKNEYLTPLQNAYDDLGKTIRRLKEDYEALARAMTATGAGSDQTYTVTAQGPYGSSKTQSFSNKSDADKWATDMYNKGFTYIKKGYALGGLNDYTGPAELHGTKSRPELVLNNSQSAALFKFISGLSGMSSLRLGGMPTTSAVSNSTDNSTVFSNCTFELETGADSVDKLINDLKNQSPIKRW